MTLRTLGSCVAVALAVVLGVGAGVPASAAILYYDTSADPGLQAGDTNDVSLPKTIAWAPNDDGSGTRVAWSQPPPVPPDDAYFQCGGTSLYTCGNMTIGALSVSNSSIVEIVSGNTSRTLVVNDSISISGDSTLRLNSYQMTWSGTPTLAMDGASQLTIKRNTKNGFTWTMGAATFTGDGGSIQFAMGSVDADPNAASIMTLSLGNITKSGGGTFSINEDAAYPTRYVLKGSGNNLNINTVAADDAISISALLASASVVTKTGWGMLTLSADNNYSGATNVNDGTLLVNGNQSAATGAVTVSSGATLGGGGILGGAVTVDAGGALAPGASVGTLMIDNTLDISAIADTGGLVFQLGADTTPGTTYDHVSMTTYALTLGTLNFADFTFTTVTGFGTGTYTLFDAGSITGSIGTATGTIGGLDATLSISGDDVLLDVLLAGGNYWAPAAIVMPV